MIVNDIRQHFISELENKNFTIDRSDQKTIELIGASFIADEPAIFGTPSEDYIQKELDLDTRRFTSLAKSVDFAPELRKLQSWI